MRAWSTSTWCSQTRPSCPSGESSAPAPRVRWVCWPPTSSSTRSSFAPRRSLGDGPALRVQLTFQTLDGDTQQVNPDEIWRIRATSTSDEPPGAIVIDYACERVYVKESLASVVEKGGRRTAFKRIYPRSLRRGSLVSALWAGRALPRCSRQRALNITRTST